MQALWNRLREKLQASYIFAFCGALFFGFLAHFYKLTNWLPNWDSLVFRHDPQQMTSLGRWFLRIAAEHPERVVVIDAGRPAEEIARDIAEDVAKLKT